MALDEESLRGGRKMGRDCVQPLCYYC
jgi:hypothetical protein